MNGSVTFSETVTLVHHIRGTDSDTYKCTLLKDVSWYETVQVSVSSDGGRTQSAVVCRILEKNLPPNLPELFDVIVRGPVESVTRPSDLEGLDAFTIKSITDNRRGNIPHIKVVCA